MSKITISSRSYASAHEISPQKRWDLCLVGGILDDRGKEAMEFLSSRCDSVKKFTYIPPTSGPQSYQIGETFMTYRQVVKEIGKPASILLECTTLGVIEILYMLKILKELQVSCVDMMYVEPYEYSRHADDDENRGVLNFREYSLSDNRRYNGVRGFTLQIDPESKGDVVFLLGFEGARLAQALEQSSLENWKKYAIFGVPAFEPGWEMNSYSNNVELIRANGFGSIRYCSASSLRETLDILEEIHNKNTEDPTIVVPIGTKPHSIAAAIFLCEHSDFQSTGILYDHQIRKDKRTIRVRKWHLHTLNFGWHS